MLYYFIFEKPYRLSSPEEKLSEMSDETIWRTQWRGKVPNSRDASSLFEGEEIWKSNGLNSVNGDAKGPFATVVRNRNTKVQKSILIFKITCL